VLFRSLTDSYSTELEKANSGIEIPLGIYLKKNSMTYDVYFHKRIREHYNPENLRDWLPGVGFTIGYSL